VGSYIPYETGHPVEGQPNLGKVIELTMNDGFDPRTQKQVGPKTGDPEKFKNFEELYEMYWDMEMDAHEYGLEWVQKVGNIINLPKEYYTLTSMITTYPSISKMLKTQNN
jgi:pyruvate-formate lyase